MRLKKRETGTRAFAGSGLLPPGTVCSLGYAAMLHRLYVELGPSTLSLFHNSAEGAPGLVREPVSQVAVNTQLHSSRLSQAVSRASSFCKASATL